MPEKIAEVLREVPEGPFKNAVTEYLEERDGQA